MGDTKQYIPNIITCGNLICGCIAVKEALSHNIDCAFILILIGMVFDFLDGMTARLLGVSSDIGKELDSLADVVTFGVAPSAMVFHLFQTVAYPDCLNPLRYILPYTAFLIAAFSALRLAKFNLDTRQTSSFIGLPTPANTLFWASLIVGNKTAVIAQHFNPLILLVIVLLSCFLLVAELPLFALKFKDFSWHNNKLKYLFIATCIPLLCLWKVSGFAAIVIWYLILSAVANKRHWI